MQVKTRIFTAVAAALLAVSIIVPGLAQQSKEAAKPGDATVLRLSISKDGRSIVDQNGEVVATITKGTTLRNIVGAKSNKNPPGCFRCHNDCVIYDENGKCISWNRTCDWDFDC